MPFAEIIYETGNKSVAYYDTNEEMKSALAEHHRRALGGEPGSGASQLRNDLDPGETRIGTWVAERIKKVLLYDEHPTDFGADQLATDKDIKAAVDAAIEKEGIGDLVPIHAVAAAIRDISNPLVAEPGPQESQYKAPETGE